MLAYRIHSDRRAPPIVKWRYDWHPEPGSPEAALYAEFLVEKDWI